VDARDHADSTPLIMAARYGNVDVIRVLLAAGADPRARDHVEATALTEGVLSGDEEVVEVLVAAGTPLDGHDRILLETPLHVAATYGYLAIARRLLAAGASADPADHEGKTPLWHAANQGHAELVRLLLARGADPGRRSRDGATPFVAAAIRGHLDVAHLLVGRTPDRARDGADAIHAAASANSTGILGLLLAHDVPADARDGAGATPLMRAAAVGAVEAVEALLEVGADPAPRDAAGRDLEAYFAAGQRRLGERIERAKRSRAMPVGLPELEASLRVRRERQARIRELIAAAAT
jgi:ankyrin repeat protein